jgi:hypothetical protein
MDTTSAAAVPANVSRPTFGQNGSPAEVHEPAQPAAARAQLREPIDFPPERRLSAAMLASLAGAAGVAAIVLGGWAFVSGVRADGSGGVAAGASARAELEEAITLLSDPGAERFRLQGSVGRIVLVVQRTGSAALVLNGLAPADSAWAYQVWVARPDATRPRSAALFSGREVVVPLAVPVPRGAVVSVTLEPADGSPAPTRTPRLFAERPAATPSP